MDELIEALREQTAAINALVESNSLFLQALVQVFEDEIGDELPAKYLDDSTL